MDTKKSRYIWKLWKPGEEVSSHLEDNHPLQHPRHLPPLGHNPPSLTPITNFSTSKIFSSNLTFLNGVFYHQSRTKLAGIGKIHWSPHGSPAPQTPVKDSHWWYAGQHSLGQTRQIKCRARITKIFWWILGASLDGRDLQPEIKQA